MARQDLLSTNFTGGELSPRLYGRPDLEKYNAGAKRLRDVVVLQHGGITRRPGTEYLGEVKDSADATRLIPFVVSQSTSYMLELGDLYMRVWKSGALVESAPSTPYELTTPYSSAVIFDVDFAQGADTAFMTLQTIYPQRLQRFGDARWTIGNCPFDPAPVDEVGLRPATTCTLGAVTGSTTATSGAAAFLAADVGRTLSSNGGEADITGYTSTTQVSISVTQDFTSTSLASGEWVIGGSPQTTCTPSAKDPVGATITLTLGAAGWRSTDVGKWVMINGGLCEITVYTSATVVSARIEEELTATVAADADAWVLESDVWTSADGYPRTVTLHEQRAIYGGSTSKPQTIWASEPGLYLSFTKGTADDNSYSFDLSSDEVNPIMFLSSARDLTAITSGGAWVLLGGVEKPITPTNVRAKQYGKAGAADVRPEQVDDDQMYVQRGGTRLRNLGFFVDVGGYQDSEASTMSEHLVTAGVSALSFQQTPERVLWVLLDDGTYAACTISRSQQMQAMTLCSAAGSGVVESMATIPEGSEDVTYMIVRRTVDGSTVRYVERMSWSACLDCAVTKTPGSATVTGLDHLEGKTVGAVADGVDLGDFTVSSGSITLPRSAASVVVGLRFTPTAKMLAPEFGTGMGAAAGRYQHNGKTSVLFHETVGCSVNGQPISFREFGESILDSAVDPFTGWKDVSDLGWDRDAGEIELTQPQAYPWTVLAVVRRMTSNPG